MQAFCEEVKELSPNTGCHATMVGVGDSTISIQPLESRKAIRNKVKESLSGDLKSCIWNHPKSFTLKIRFINYNQLTEHHIIKEQN